MRERFVVEVPAGEGHIGVIPPDFLMLRADRIRGQMAGDFRLGSRIFSKFDVLIPVAVVTGAAI